MRLSRSLAILFAMSVVPMAVHGAAPSDARMIEISLDRIPRHLARGTENLRSLEPEFFPARQPGREYSLEELRELKSKAKESLNMQLERAMAAMRQAPNSEKRPGGFAVEGAGRKALQGAYEVLVKGNPPKVVFDSASEVSIVFYSLPQQPYVGLDRVQRRGNVVEVHFMLISHTELDSSWNLALIPLGKLPPGRYRVEMIRSPNERKFNAGGMPPIPANWEQKLISGPFDFEVVKQPD